MHITLELATIFLLAGLSGFLLSRIGRLSSQVKYYSTAAMATQHGLVVTYETLNEVLTYHKEASPQLIESISDDFAKRMNKHMEEMEVKWHA